MRLLCVLWLCGCGAARWPELSVTRWSVDGPPRAEVMVDGVPLLFDIDPEASGGTLCVEWASRLGLSIVGNPARGARQARASLDGEAALLEVTDDDRGVVHGRTVVGVLGAKLRDRLGLSRFGPHRCGDRLEKCVRGRVTRLSRGEVWLQFDRPEQALPPRMWARVDLGLPGRPRLMLVRLRPDKYRRFMLRIEDADIGPETVRAPPAPIDVVDLVPLGAQCLGQVCRVE